MASYKRNRGALNADEIFELESILGSQQSILQKRLAVMLPRGDGDPSGVSFVNSTTEHEGFVLLTSDLSEEQAAIVRKEILKLQLKTTKQIVLLLNLREIDFRYSYFVPTIKKSSMCVHSFPGSPLPNISCPPE